MYRILKKAFSLVIALTLLLGIGLSSAYAMDYQYAGHRDPIILYEDSLAGLARGDTLQLGISGGAVVSCSSSNGKIASIDPTGLVTAKKAGKTKITVAGSNGATFTLSLTVVDPKKPKKISFINKKDSQYVGLKKDIRGFLTAKPYVEAFDIKSVKWSSSDEDVAKVNKNGVVTAYGKGSATITAKTKNGKTAKLKFTAKSNKLKDINDKPNPTYVYVNNYYLYLKSVEILSPRKVELEYYVVFNYPASYSADKFNYIDTIITYYDPYTGTRKTLVNGRVKNVDVDLEGLFCVKKFKVTYSGKSVANTDVKISDHLGDIVCSWQANLRTKHTYWVFNDAPADVDVEAEGVIEAAPEGETQDTAEPEMIFEDIVRSSDD